MLRFAVAVVPSSLSDSDLGLRSKSHLADFWDRLSQAERWKLIGSSMVSSEGHHAKGSKKDRHNTSGAASVTSAASATSLLTSSFGSHSGSHPTSPPAFHRSKSGPTHDDDVATLGSDGAFAPSSALSVGAASAGNTSFGVFDKHARHRYFQTCCVFFDCFFIFKICMCFAAVEARARFNGNH